MDPATRETAENPVFDLSDLDYELPPELIAQHPPARREDARLLVLSRADGSLQDRGVFELPLLLTRGDLLVLNDTRVIPAKFTAARASGRRIEGLFLGEPRVGEWQVMLRGSSRLRVGQTLTVVGDSECRATLTLVERRGGGRWEVEVAPAVSAVRILEQVGTTPLPPYIQRQSREPSFSLAHGSAGGRRMSPGDQLPRRFDDPETSDKLRYQTIYARVPGAVAAPTAGLHFTERMLDEVKQRGVEIAMITLHVGLGTFKPISSPSLDQHAIHAENMVVPEATATAVAACKDRGGRVVAVGTTVVRALEAAAEGRGVRPMAGATQLFIRPPYAFRVVDAMLTNFHLPRSTLLALVMTFAGTGRIRAAYRHAIEAHYRFYSYGDAMFIA